MKTNRIACLSPLALLIALLTLMILIFAEIFSVKSMFSPGDLSEKTGPSLGGVTSHAEIGKDCNRCHVPFWSSRRMNDLCLECHIEIQGELEDSSTLHGMLVRDVDSSCRSCHTEHSGPDASLTVMDPATFPHEVTGFALTGHQIQSEGTRFDCSDCHSEGISFFNQQTCAECHRDLDAAYTVAHIETFGGYCLDCHDGTDRYGEFDHSKVKFALTGAHLRAECSDCHLNARNITDLQNTASTCESCHLEDDVHAGKFGLTCGICHSSDGWKPAEFDHNLSGFPLDGAHVDVECGDCHKNEIFKGTPSECTACHIEPTLHAGMFQGEVCKQCHTTDSWTPANYDGPHTFPMNHGDENNTCTDCHQPTLAQWTCYTCHDRNEIEEEHNEEGIADISDCLRCHPTGQEDEAEGDGDDD